MTFRPIAHKDVHGRVILYVELEHNGNKVHINIGARNFEAVTDLLRSNKQLTIEDQAKKEPAKPQPKLK